MRMFEIILLVLNGLALGLVWRRPSKQIWLAVAGVTVAALVLHGLLEGFRWQMAVSYGLVFWTCVYALGSTTRFAPGFGRHKILKVLSVGLAGVMLAVTAFLAYALPVFKLPQPTGTYAVGVKYVELVDQSRTDPFLQDTTQKRAVMAKIVYPARADARKPYQRYFGGSRALMEGFAAFYHVPKFVFSHFGLITTHAKADLELSDKKPNYPVVLFSNGAGTGMEVETTQSEDLASHGYVVVDIDHPYVSAATVFPNRTVLASEATKDFKVAEPAAPITQIMADDQKFVISELARMNTVSGGMLGGKLDMNEVGVMGHSVGGATAYNMAINDPRVKAAVNLDGAVYVTPRDTKAVAPMLMLANDKYHVEAIKQHQSLMKHYTNSADDQAELKLFYGSQAGYDTEYARAQANTNGLVDVLKTQNSLYTIDGSDHMKFADVGLFIGSGWLRNLLQISGSEDPARNLTVSNALTVRFFDQHLKGAKEPLDGLSQTYPELKHAQL